MNTTTANEVATLVDRYSTTLDELLAVRLRRRSRERCWDVGSLGRQCKSGGPRFFNMQGGGAEVSQ